MKRIKKIVQTRRLTHPDNLAGMYVEFTISGGQGNYQVEQEFIHPNKEQYSHYRTPYGHMKRLVPTLKEPQPSYTNKAIN